MILLIIFLLLVLCAGGYVGYRYWQYQKEVEDSGGESEEIGSFWDYLLNRKAEDTDSDDDSDDADDSDTVSDSDDADNPDATSDAEGEDTAPDNAAILAPVDEQLEAVKTEYEAASYTNALNDSIGVLEQYMSVGEGRHPMEEAQDHIAEAFSIASRSAIESSRILESQQPGSAIYEQICIYVDPVVEMADTLTQAGYTVDSQEITDYSDGIVPMFREKYIQIINSFTERDQWSRDEAWTYAEQAYKTQKDGKTVLFDVTDLDDPLRLRYVYCFAWITAKRCESMTPEDAFENLTAVLEETDYNPLLLQDIITYGTTAKKDVSRYQAAYDAIVKKIKEEQKFSIVKESGGVSSASSAELRKFWYFNDLSGDAAYIVDSNNGTTQATRDWIRANVPGIIDPDAVAQ